MSQKCAEAVWEELIRNAGPYPLEAFNFVRAGLQYTAERVEVNVVDAPEPERHITGQQLCIGLRDFAIEQYGMLAREVLGHWHVHRTADFGRIVFAMVDAGLMSKTEDDSINDFRGVYDFDEAFSDDQLLTHFDHIAQ